jgi:cell division protein FtsW
LLAAKEALVNDVRQFILPFGAVIGSMLVLIEIQPDLGSAVMIAVTSGILVFVAGLRWRFIAGTAAVGFVALCIAVAAQPYRLRRIRTFLDPSADTLGSAFQLNQSLLALGSGGLTGVGLGQSQQKAYFLPAPHTDFIFSVVGEEFGLVGTLVLLIAALLVFWRGRRAALGAPDRFGFYLALGCTVFVVLQSLIHMGVCVGLLPTKGLPFPLVSYGGSSLIAVMAATGLLLNVSKHAD